MDKVNQWNEELSLLSKVPVTQPHAVYAAFTYGFVSKFTYLGRTVPDIRPRLCSLEFTIRCKLTPTLTNRPPPNNIERDVLAMPPGDYQSNYSFIG